MDVLPLKQLGQNFLTDTSYVNRLVEALEIGANAGEIIEIGPGTGTVTDVLLSKLSPNQILYAVDVDKRVTDLLRKKYQNKNLRIIQENILDWLPSFTANGGFRIIGSLPYYITSPILHCFVKLNKRPLSIAIIIQEEVAQKLCAKTPSTSYLSVFLQTFYEVTYIKKVPKELFFPIPQVDGAIVKLVNKDNVLIATAEVSKYEGFLHKAYKNPRKMLNKAFTTEELTKTNIQGNLRPQNISTEEWVKAFKAL